MNIPTDFQRKFCSKSAAIFIFAFLHFWSYFRICCIKIHLYTSFHALGRRRREVRGRKREWKKSWKLNFFLISQLLVGMGQWRVTGRVARGEWAAQLWGQWPKKNPTSSSSKLYNFCLRAYWYNLYKYVLAHQFVISYFVLKLRYPYDTPFLIASTPKHHNFLPSPVSFDITFDSFSTPNFFLFYSI